MLIVDAIETYKQHYSTVDAKEIKRLYYREVDVTVEEIEEEIKNDECV